MVRIAVIGAGAAGLSAAHHLLQNGCEVKIYERSSFVGGQASTFEVLKDIPLERGYHHLFISDTDIIELIDHLGLSSQLKWIPSKVGTFTQGKTFKFTTALDLLKFSPLNLIDRLRLGFLSLYLSKISDWHNLESSTAVNWLKNFGGQNIYDVFWEPMLQGKFGKNYFSQVNMAWIWGKINTRFASRKGFLAKELLGYPLCSFGTVFDELVRSIKKKGGIVELSREVTKIISLDQDQKVKIISELKADTWQSPTKHDFSPETIEFESKEKNIHTDEFDAVIVTTPSYVFSNIIDNIPRDYQPSLLSQNYLSAILLILVLKSPLSEYYWLNIADRKIPFVGVIEHTNLADRSNYNDKHIVYLSNYVSKDDPLLKKNHKDLLDLYLPHLKKINKDFSKDWIEESFYQRVDAAQPIVGINYSSQILSHETPFPNIYLANTTQIYPEDRGTNYSIKIGKKVAKLLLTNINKTLY